MAIRNRFGHNQLQTTINVTPLVDVALTLLIVFMLTAPLMQQGLPVNLPEAASPALKRTKKDVVLTVQSTGKIFLGDDKTMIPMDELAGRLGAIFSSKQQKDLFVKADTDLRYGTVVKVMSLAKKAGVDRIGMITQPETSLSNNK
jgi:biopolymer transport protein TolR